MYITYTFAIIGAVVACGAAYQGYRLMDAVIGYWLGRAGVQFETSEQIARTTEQVKTFQMRGKPGA